MAIAVRSLRFTPKVVSEKDLAVWVTSKPIPPSGAPALKATRFHEGSDGFVLGAKAVISELLRLGWKQPHFELFVTAASTGAVKQGYDAIKLWLNSENPEVNGHFLSLGTQSSTAPVGLTFTIRSQD